VPPEPVGPYPADSTATDHLAKRAAPFGLGLGPRLRARRRPHPRPRPGSGPSPSSAERGPEGGGQLLHLDQALLQLLEGEEAVQGPLEFPDVPEGVAGQRLGHPVGQLAFRSSTFRRMMATRVS
jgi:hypothetical protein